MIFFRKYFQNCSLFKLIYDKCRQSTNFCAIVDEKEKE